MMGLLLLEAGRAKAFFKSRSIRTVSAVACAVAIVSLQSVSHTQSIVLVCTVNSRIIQGLTALQSRRERMARHYSTKDFFWQMPNALLDRYFESRWLGTKWKTQPPRCSMFGALCMNWNGPRRLGPSVCCRLDQQTNLSRRNCGQATSGDAGQDL